MQKEANNDQELIFKKRARRRLVGAIALVLMMIVVLPMILKDRSSMQPKEEITITLSNENSSNEGLPLNSADKTRNETKNIEKPTDEFDSNIDNAKVASNEIASQEFSQIPLETLKNNTKLNNDSDITSAETPVPVDKSVALKADEAAKKAINKKTNDVDSSNPNIANLNKQRELKPNSTGLFYVQVGVFSDANNVKQLQAKLNDIGYKSQTEKINTDKGVKIRLRTQSFGSRANAANALENIKEAGLTGMVVSKAGA